MLIVTARRCPSDRAVLARSIETVLRHFQKEAG
jgi:hypothetical protein